MKGYNATGLEPVQQAAEDQMPPRGRNMLQNKKRMNKAIDSAIGVLTAVRKRL